MCDSYRNPGAPAPLPSREPHPGTGVSKRGGGGGGADWQVSRSPLLTDWQPWTGLESNCGPSQPVPQLVAMFLQGNFRFSPRFLSYCVRVVVPGPLCVPQYPWSPSVVSAAFAPNLPRFFPPGGLVELIRLGLPSTWAPACSDMAGTVTWR